MCGKCARARVHVYVCVCVRARVRVRVRVRLPIRQRINDKLLPVCFSSVAGKGTQMAMSYRSTFSGLKVLPDNPVPPLTLITLFPAIACLKDATNKVLVCNFPFNSFTERRGGEAICLSPLIKT